MYALAARLVVADALPMVVAGLRAVLSGRYRVVATACTAATLLDALRRHRADILILGADLPDRNGLDVLPTLRARYPRLRILVLLPRYDAMVCVALRAAGANGCVAKNCGRLALLAALRRVTAGRRAPSPGRHARAAPQAEVPAYPGLNALTPRQWEVLRLLGDGRTTRQIADRLGLSHQMISLHRHNLRQRLGIASEAGLLQCAMLVRLCEAPRAGRMP